MSKKKVIIGLSGGVDSSVGVIELLKQGYDVEAMFMRNWDSATNNDMLGNPTINDDVCPQEVDFNDAKKVADKLGVKLHRIDFIEEYWQMVFKYFLDEYEHGRTPNPDILCNKEIKFKAFLKHALTLGADYIAMGHYARVVHADKNYLLRGIDENKDQSYFLCQLTSEQLGKSLFPIGNLTKPEVRAIAKEYDLATADKKDSTGVCFIGERNFKQFLQNYIPATTGDMMTKDGQVVGRHDGVMYYTIGQRKGLNIGGHKESIFVIDTDIEDNVIYVGEGHHHPGLLRKALKISADEVHWIREDMAMKSGESREYKVRIRYRQPLQDAVLYQRDKYLYIVFKEHQRGISAGQFAVWYDENGEMLGSGVIDL